MLQACIVHDQTQMDLVEADLSRCVATIRRNHPEAHDRQYLEVLEAPLSQLMDLVY